MIPKRCYDDLWFLKDKVRQHRKDFVHNKLIVSECDIFIHALEDMTFKWRQSDDAEMDDMYEDFEKSEKDCMWDRD